ncbi:probable RNA-binding protein 46 isoform X1 [Dermacentor albipictus]|uniref:probable RNA-binding protein 46 isoform X1 n=1 Tax=Dermacentor albipictus TaxID=60249 RepID=UPI0031FD13A9
MLPGSFTPDRSQRGGSGERGYSNRPGHRRRRGPSHHQLAGTPLHYYYADGCYYPHPGAMPESGIHDPTQGDGRASSAAAGHARAGGSQGSSSRSSSSTSCAADAASTRKSVSVLPPRERRLLTLMDRTGYPMVQDNGQRRYGPPPFWQGEPPPKGCEVFVGKLPRDLYEDELVPFLERAGRLYEVRLMMDFAGSNRGYAFATYSTRREARVAVRDLDEREIRRGRRVGVCESLDNCRLFVGGLPRDKSREDVLEEMRRVTEGVVDVILYPNVADKTRNRGFAFVEYADHKAAAVARRRMIPGKMTLWGGYEVAVDWAEPEPIVDDETMKKVMVLYVRNLMLGTSEDAIREAFSLEGQLNVAKVKKIRDFAFVHYSSREDATLALEAMKGAEIEGAQIEVAWSKPVSHWRRYDRIAGSTKKGKVPPRGGSLCGAPVMMPSPVAAVGYGFYPLAPHHVPLPIGSGRPGGEDVIHSHNGRAALPYPGNARLTSRCQRVIQILVDMCERQGWGDPQFQLVTVMSSECNAPDSNETQTPLHFFKVTLPNVSPPMYNTITPNKFCRTVEEAREYAAEYALHHLLLRLEMGTPAHYPHLTSPVFVATPAAPALGQGYPPYTAIQPRAGSADMNGPPWQQQNPDKPPSPPPL